MGDSTAQREDLSPGEERRSGAGWAPKTRAPLRASKRHMCLEIASLCRWTESETQRFPLERHNHPNEVRMKLFGHQITDSSHGYPDKGTCSELEIAKNVCCSERITAAAEGRVLSDYCLALSAVDCSPPEESQRPEHDLWWTENGPEPRSEVLPRLDYIV